MLHFISLFLPKKSWRHAVRSYAKMHNTYTRRARKTAQSIGSNFVCNQKVLLNERTIIDDCVRLNGLKVPGGGVVQFGNQWALIY